MKSRGFEVSKKKTEKVNVWKGLVILVLLLPVLSFFSFVDKIYADKKNLINLFSNQLSVYSRNSFPSYIGKLFYDYKQGKNIFLTDKEGIFLLLDKPFLVSSLLGVSYTNVKEIFSIVKTYYADISNLLGINGKKTYLIIFENTAEQRPDGGFFGSFAKVSFSGGHIVDFKIYDSYYLLWKYCSKHTKNLPKKNWFKYCNKSGLNIQNSIEPFDQLFSSTTFLTSNIFGFTSLNAKNIVKHYNKVFSDKIDGVIFVKSDILDYLLPNGKKIFWEMEYLNYLSKQNGFLKLQDTKNLKGLEGKKARYLLFLHNLIKKNRVNILKNFINNFEKIKQAGLIRVYFFDVSFKFKQFLLDNNFDFEKQSNFLYFFFYNLGFSKNSHLVDHIVKINDKIYVNPVKVYLYPGLYSINIKHIFRGDFFYEEFLKQKGLTGENYLNTDKLDYKTLLILPKNCVFVEKRQDFYLIECK